MDTAKDPTRPQTRHGSDDGLAAASAAPPVLPGPKDVLLWGLVYASVAGLGHLFGLAPQDLHLFAPQSGVAVAVVVLFGPRLLLSVLLGGWLYYLFTVWSGATPLAAVVSAASLALIGTVQALLAARLVGRALGSPVRLLTARCVGLFLLSAGVLAGGFGVIARALFWWHFAPPGPCHDPMLLAFGWFAELAGVAIAAPLVFAWAGGQTRLWRDRRTPLSLPVVLALTLVMVLSAYAERTEREQAKLEFANHATILAGALRRELDRYTEAVQALRDFIVGSPSFTREDFQRFVKGALARYPGIHALSWNPLISAHARERYVAAARADGLDNFQLTERSPDGQLRRAAARDEHVAVYYIAPRGGNERALGYDVSSNPTRRLALHAARDSGVPRVTRRLRLVQEEGDAAGILVFTPVYQRGQPVETVAQRRHNLKGYAAGVLRMTELVEGSIADIAADLAVDLQLLDRSAPADDSVLARIDNGWVRRVFDESIVTGLPDIRVNKSFDFAGRNWEVLLTPSSARLPGSHALAPMLVLGSGLLVATLLSVFQLLLSARQAELIEGNASLKREAAQRRKAQERQLETEARYRALVEHAPEAIVVFDADLGRFVDFNAIALQLFGCDREALLAMDPWELSPPRQPDGSDSRERAAALIQRALEGESPRFEWVHRDVSGREIPCEIWLVRLPAAGRRLVRGTMTDITERKRTERALFREKEKAEVALHSIGEAIIVTDRGGRVEYMNRVAEIKTGWGLSDARGRRAPEVLTLVDHATHQPFHSFPLDLQGEAGRLSHERRVLLRSRGGEEYAIQASVAPMRGPRGEFLGSVLAINDITELRQLTQQLAHRASHDALTGLVNRDEFERRLAAALAASGQRGTPNTLSYLDLDQFKVVNDTVGHRAGDELLRQITALLSAKMRSRDTLGRIGGDEFCILFEDCTLDDAQRIAQSLIDDVTDFRFSWDGRTFDIGVSIGLVAVDGAAADVGQLMSRADMACYSAKERGRGQVCAYRGDDPDMLGRQCEMLRVAGLREAIAEGRMRLYAQEIRPLQVGDRARAFHELLLRMQDDDGELLRPGQFIPAAERYGMMGSIDRWVIAAAFDRCRFGLNGINDGGITINLSGNSLNDKSLLEHVLREQQRSGIDPQTVCFEITETSAINHVQHAIEFIHALRSHGFLFALDDFGSGLSSFSYLKRFDVDLVKIDGNFVRNMREQPTDRAVVEAIHQICHSLEIRTVAECVEDEAVIEQLRDMGIDYVQGYAIGREVPLTALTAR